jgi:rsbT co-antagonist protein RsbR
LTINTDETRSTHDVLRDHEDEVLAGWASVLTASLRGRLSRAEVTVQLREIYDALLTVADGRVTLDLDAEEAAELRSALAGLSGNWARAGFTPGETALAVFALKDALSQVLDTDNAGPEVTRGLLALDRLIDKLGLFTFETYVRAREELITGQAEQLLELSTPVVKLWDGVVAVPLVGTLDSARAQVVMERLLQTLVDTGSAYAIIDITGVPAVDTQVAQHVLKTVMAARLMGAECVISGIRPQIAQTIVALGIEFGDIVTKSSLADALVHALRSSGVEVVRRNRPTVG